MARIRTGPGRFEDQSSADRMCVLLYNFDFDWHELKHEHQPPLDRIVDLLQGPNGGSVTLKGMADRRGTEAYNMALSQRRVTEVLNYLQRAVRRPFGRMIAPLGESVAEQQGVPDAAMDELYRAVGVTAWRHPQPPPPPPLPPAGQCPPINDADLRSARQQFVNHLRSRRSPAERGGRHGIGGEHAAHEALEFIVWLNGYIYIALYLVAGRGTATQARDQFVTPAHINQPMYRDGGEHAIEVWTRIRAPRGCQPRELRRRILLMNDREHRGYYNDLRRELLDYFRRQYFIYMRSEPRPDELPRDPGCADRRTRQVVADAP